MPTISRTLLFFCLIQLLSYQTSSLQQSPSPIKAFFLSAPLLERRLMAVEKNLMAGEMDDIKARFIERKPALGLLLSSGKIGENNQGFLELREELSETETALFEAENSDRKTVYQIIAKKNNSSLEKIGSVRAEKIHSQLKAGVWYQNAEGSWVKS